jgi:hypothetical protein
MDIARAVFSPNQLRPFAPKPGAPSFFGKPRAAGRQIGAKALLAASIALVRKTTAGV